MLRGRMNDVQSQAIFSDITRPLLVVAGAGSGKTLVMVNRIQHIVSSGIKPKEILAITFTRNAADEMRTRLKDLKGGDGIVVLTIHSWCLRILREFFDNLRAGYNGSAFTIASIREQAKIVDDALSEFDLQQGREAEIDPKARQARARKVLQKLQKIRSTSRSPSDLILGSEIRVVFEYYERKMRESNTLDFQDFIYLTTSLFDDEGVSQKIRSRHRYVLVDEFQDVSSSQFILLRALMGESNGSITVVGGFITVPMYDNFVKPHVRQQAHFLPRGMTTVRLEQNYRSSAAIVSAANSVISLNTMRTKKRVWTSRDIGDRVCVVECRNSACEMTYVAAEIKRRNAAGAPFSSMALLYRTNLTGSSFQSALRSAGIPISVQGESVYSPLEVEDCLSFLRLCINEFDDRSFVHVAKVLKCSFSKEFMGHLKQNSETHRVSLIHACRLFLRQHTKAKGNKGEKRDPCSDVRKLLDCYDTLILRLGELPLPSFVKRVIDLHPWVKNRMHRAPSTSSLNTTGESYGDLGSALIKEAENFDKSLSHEKCEVAMTCEDQHTWKLKLFLDHLALCSEGGDHPLQENLQATSKGKDSPRDAVFLGTVHQAKGLEWPIVFIVRFNEEEFPLAMRQSDGNANDVIGGDRCKRPGKEFVERSFDEEERRLGYVALSRAKNSMIITFILQDASGASIPPSRFLRDIPKDITERDELMSSLSSSSSCSLSREETRSSPILGVNISDSTFLSGKIEEGPWAKFVRNPAKRLNDVQSSNHSTAVQSTTIILENGSAENNSSSSSNDDEKCNKRPGSYISKPTKVVKVEESHFPELKVQIKQQSRSREDFVRSSQLLIPNEAPDHFKKPFFTDD